MGNGGRHFQSKGATAACSASSATPSVVRSRPELQALSSGAIPISASSAPATSTLAATATATAGSAATIQQQAAANSPTVRQFATPLPIGAAGQQLDDQLDQLNARESPSKITHGFWLQQYSWLHHTNKSGIAGDDLVPPDDHLLLVAQLSSGAIQSARGQQQQHPSAKQKLLARWRGLKRTLGGSAGEVRASDGHNRWPLHSPVRAAPGGASASDSPAEPTARARPQKRKNWFLRSVVSSSTTNLPGDGCFAKQTELAGASTQRRSRSSLARAPPTFTNDQHQQLAPPQPPKSPIKSSTSSPYRQIARVFRAATGRTKSAAECTPGAGRKRRRSPTQRESANEATAGATPTGDESGAGNEVAQRRDGADLRRRQHCDEQISARSMGKQTTGKESGGILSNIFAVSPLFRRRRQQRHPKRRLAEGDAEQSGRNSPLGHNLQTKGALIGVATLSESKTKVKRQHKQIRAGGEFTSPTTASTATSPTAKMKTTKTQTTTTTTTTKENYANEAAPYDNRKSAAEATQLNAAETKLALASGGGSESSCGRVSGACQLREERTLASCGRRAAVKTKAGGESIGSDARAGSRHIGDHDEDHGAPQATCAMQTRGDEEKQRQRNPDLGLQPSGHLATRVSSGVQAKVGALKFESLSPATFSSSNEDDDDDDEVELQVASEDDDDNGGRNESQLPRQQQSHCRHKQRLANEASEPKQQLLKLIQPLGSSSSSFASSSICLDLQANASIDATAPTNADRNPLLADELATAAVSSSLVALAADVEAQNSCPPPGGQLERPASQPQTGEQAQKQQQQQHQQHMHHSTAKRRPQIAQAPSSGAGALKDNFKRLVKRQQSVDSYRMARELKRKQKQQSESRQKHQSNEAIEQQSGGCNVNLGSGEPTLSHSQSNQSQQQQRSLLAAAASGKHDCSFQAATQGQVATRKPMKIRIEQPLARGKFAISVTDSAIEQNSSTIADAETEPASASATSQLEELSADQRVPPTPPSSLNLMPSSHLAPDSSAAGHHSSFGAGSGGASPFMLGNFSGCITPTYPTHHLPSPKYVSPNVKKYSNASTISSLVGGDGSRLLSGAGGGGASNGNQASAAAADTTTATTNASDTESSMGGGSVTPSRGTRIGGGQMGELNQLANSASMAQLLSGSSAMNSSGSQRGLAAQASEAAAAARRANLAEHIYDNKCGLGEDMKFLASLPELCDITFLVGETREPVCAVKSVLAARSRVFHKILFGGQRMRRIARQQRQEEELGAGNQEFGGDLRRDSSPKHETPKVAPVAKVSSPLSRSTSPNQQQQPHWSVTSDASGYNVAPSPYSDSAPAPGGGPPPGYAAADPQRGGRVSVTSAGRGSSVGQSSLGSQQPLIIGPGQTAAPATANNSGKRNKKASIRDAAVGAIAASHAHNHHHYHQQSSGTTSRLSRMFLKRASDPSIKRQQSKEQHGAKDQPASNYLDKMSSSQMSTTMIIEEFEPDVFRQLIEYIHTGCVLLQARTLLGLLNAADYYGLEQLRKACLRFVSCCITVDTVCSLLSTAERYIQYKCTKSIVQKVLEFVDTHANEIFKLNAFGLLPEHVVRLILARDGLKADEHVKYNGVHTWCEHYCRSYELTNIADVMRNFLDLIQFHKIPTSVLLSEIYPTHIVPDTIFLSALACQADPQNFEPQPSRQRRMTLPNPMIYKDDSSDDYNDERDSNKKSPRASQQQPARSSVQVDASDGRRPSQKKRRKASGNLNPESQSPSTGGSREQLVQLARSSSRKGRQPLDGRKGSSAGQACAPPTASKQRKGSIVQVSISGAIRLSHKLSIRRKHRGNGQQSEGARRQSVGKQQSLISAGSGATSGNNRQLRQLSSVNIQTSTTTTTNNNNNEGGRADPLAVGQQILNAYLLAQRQRELEEEERKRKELAERQAAAQEAKRAAAAAGSATGQSAASGADLPGGQPRSQSIQQSSQQQSNQQLRRKSFRDFKNISRRLFMRHSSSKLLQQSSSGASDSITTPPTSSGGSATPANLALGSGGGQPRMHMGANRQVSEGIGSSTSGQPSGGCAINAKRRNLLKIKRSETVYESSLGASNQPIGARTSISQASQPTTAKISGGGAKLTSQLSSALVSIGSGGSPAATNK